MLRDLDMILLSHFPIPLLLCVIKANAIPAMDKAQDLAISTNSSEPRFLNFVGDPNGRGTLSLVISCLLTLVLCVWSALHLNVPLQADTRLHYVFVNIRWIITGVYAPELVVFTAWRQWSSARILGKIVGQQMDGREKTAKNQWTKTHDFFACTGGFAFDLSESEAFVPRECPTRLTITARGMALLARCGHLPDIPRVDILDKSKANDLAKALVMIQAFWMLVQVLGRLIVKLPVTLLEVNTIAHV